nr:hypothetical protein Iba_chr09aCG9560 [Ipomoea batatas]
MNCLKNTVDTPGDLEKHINWNNGEKAVQNSFCIIRGRLSGWAVVLGISSQLGGHAGGCAWSAVRRFVSGSMLGQHLSSVSTHVLYSGVVEVFLLSVFGDSRDREETKSECASSGVLACLGCNIMAATSIWVVCYHHSPVCLLDLLYSSSLSICIGSKRNWELMIDSQDESINMKKLERAKKPGCSQKMGTGSGKTVERGKSGKKSPPMVEIAFVNTTSLEHNQNISWYLAPSAALPTAAPITKGVV